MVGNKDIDGEVFDLSVFFVSWFYTPHDLVRKVQTLTERLFYIRAVVNKWSKEVLTAKIADDLFHHKGELAHNFIQTIPDVRQSLKTIGNVQR